jgi:hypothetical protein
MKSGFPDPIESQVKARSMNSPFDCTQPEYDQRSSCFVNVGSHYGVGHKNPVGHRGSAKSKVSTLPSGRVDTMKVAQVPVKNYPIDMES